MEEVAFEVGGNGEYRPNNFPIGTVETLSQLLPEACSPPTEPSVADTQVSESQAGQKSVHK
jgi:hypothetical protein